MVFLHLKNRSAHNFRNSLIKGTWTHSKLHTNKGIKSEFIRIRVDTIFMRVHYAQDGY